MARRARGKPDNTGRNASLQILLEDLGPEETRPEIAVTAWSRTGEELHSSAVDKDGKASFPPEVLDKAYKVRVGPAQAEPEQLSEVALAYGVERFRAVLDTGTLHVARPIWDNWFPRIRCVSGRVRVCRRSPWWYADLDLLTRLPVARDSEMPSPSVMTRVQHANTEFGAIGNLHSRRLPPVLSADQLILWPFRCAPVCQGTVDVYRRICCCKPWVIFDSRLRDLIRELEEIVRSRSEAGPLPQPPEPGPDPAPFARGALFKEGALDEGALRAGEDLQALRAMPAEEVPTYINARPYLFCRGYSCGQPVKVAEGQLGPDGRFNICWLSLLPRPKPRCHEEYAYIVKQRFGPFTIVIYNGVAASRWHQAGDDPTLTSYHPLAYGCRNNPAGAFVFLDLIGDTGAHQLITPTADGAASVASPGYNSGLVFPAPSPAAALGADLNRNWGGTLKLSFMFSEGLQDIGAKYYRISVTEADAAGNPAGPRYYLDAGLSWNKAVPDGSGGVDIVPVGLGPTSAGTQNFLYLIPYDTNPTTDWNDGQYHAHLDTTDTRWSDPTKRHLLTLEIFDSTGQRLRPNGAPASGLGGAEVAAAFTYRRRYQETGATAEIPFGALTHMLWWDNRDVVADIVDLRRNGFIFNAECLFFGGVPSSTFSVGYRAYHPSEAFQLYHQITWRRGLGSTASSSGTLQPNTTANVGVPPAPPGGSATNTFWQMLRPDLDPTRQKCAFTAFLDIWNKRTDGDDLGHQHRGDTAAFVIEIES